MKPWSRWSRWSRFVALAVAFVSVPTSVQAADPPPPQAASKPNGRPLTITGSVLIMASAAGYVVMAVGLGMGNNADSQVRSLGGTDDLERRRDVMDRGELGNRLALGAGLASVALMAAGIALVVVGRRRSKTPRASAGVLPLPRGAGVAASARF